MRIKDVACIIKIWLNSWMKRHFHWISDSKPQFPALEMSFFSCFLKEKKCNCLCARVILVVKKIFKSCLTSIDEKYDCLIHHEKPPLALWWVFFTFCIFLLWLLLPASAEMDCSPQKFMLYNHLVSLQDVTGLFIISVCYFKYQSKLYPLK